MRACLFGLALISMAFGTNGWQYYRRQKQRSSSTAAQKERSESRLYGLTSGIEKWGAEDLIRSLEKLELMEKRAEVDEFCTKTVDCSNVTNLLIVDGVEFPTMNGQCNNVDNWSWGITGVQHTRLLSNAYDNGKWKERSRSVTSGKGVTVTIPSPRDVSNAVHSVTEDKADNTQNVSLALFYFMQFIDHDILKTPEGTVSSAKDCCTDNTGFCMPLILEGDPVLGDLCMDARRSDTKFDCTDTDMQNQYNNITAYLDGSMIYGSAEYDSSLLRTGIGGRLVTSTDDFLPEATDTSSQECENVASPAFCLKAGDDRADVHASLTMFHIVFMREHNRIANYLGDTNSGWSDDRIFYTTRRIVASMIQHITLKEMLPKVLDSSMLDAVGLTSNYVYNSSASASIIQAFNIAYRYHHMMAATFHTADLVGSTVTNTGEYEQEDVWENPGYLFEDNYHGVDSVALGQVINGCPMATGQMNNASRNSLFKDSDGNSFDLAALNIAREREWGTPPYYQYRDLCGVGSDTTTWDQLTTTHSQDDIDALLSVYDDVRDVDLWTGLVTETTVGDSISGPTQSCLVALQFALLRKGDRFWYEHLGQDFSLSNTQLTEIQKVTLAGVMCQNLDVATMATDVFDVNSAWDTCSGITHLDLSAWNSS